MTEIVDERQRLVASLRECGAEWSVQMRSLDGTVYGPGPLLNEAADQIEADGKLSAEVDRQDREIAELERRVAALAAPSEGNKTQGNPISTANRPDREWWDRYYADHPDARPTPYEGNKKGEPVIFAVDPASPDGDKSIGVEATRAPDGTVKILSVGEVIEGTASRPQEQPRKATGELERRAREVPEILKAVANKLNPDLLDDRSSSGVAATWLYEARGRLVEYFASPAAAQGWQRHEWEGYVNGLTWATNRVGKIRGNDAHTVNALRQLIDAEIRRVEPFAAAPPSPAAQEQEP